jgi:hypothetical protein
MFHDHCRHFHPGIAHRSCTFSWGRNRTPMLVCQNWVCNRLCEDPIRWKRGRLYGMLHIPIPFCSHGQSRICEPRIRRTFGGWCSSRRLLRKSARSVNVVASRNQYEGGLRDWKGKGGELGREAPIELHNGAFCSANAGSYDDATATNLNR